MHAELQTERLRALQTHCHCLSLSQRCLFLARGSTARRVFSTSSSRAAFENACSIPRGRRQAARCSSINHTARVSVTGRGRNSRLKASSDGLPSSQQSVPPTSAQVAELQSSKQRNVKWAVLAAGIVAIAGFLLYKDSTSLQDAKTSLNQSVLGRSGFLAAFSLIFISEIGDKTFFIAGLLAAKVGRWKSLIGSSAALGLMTVISVGIGSAFKSLPDVLKSSLPVGQYLGAALMLLFGVRTISEAWQTKSDGGEDGDGELHEAQVSVSTAEKDWNQQGGLWATLLQVGTLIFLAEWGDRSMLATIALGASHPPIGVAVGATLAHIAATFIAVVSGAIASQYVSEKTIGYIGGALFLMFSFLTFFGYF